MKRFIQLFTLILLTNISTHTMGTNNIVTRTYTAIDNTMSKVFGKSWPLAAVFGGYFIERYGKNICTNAYNTIHAHLTFKTEIKEHIINLKEYTPEVTYNNLIGMEEVKDLFSSISNFIINPKPFLDTNSIPPTRCLLSGPAGSGKDFFIQTFIGQLATQLQQNAPDKDIHYLAIHGMDAKKHGIEKIFTTIQKYAPAIVYIDECDLLYLQRGNDSTLVSNFLTGNGIFAYNNPENPIILIMTTNRPATCDPTLFAKPSGFKEIRFEYPPFRFRKAFLLQELNAMGIESSQFDLDVLARKTDGCSFSHLRALLDKSLFGARMLSVPLSQSILEKTINSELYTVKPIKKIILSEHEKLIIASHFAGQALAYHLFNTGKMVEMITLKTIAVELEVKSVLNTPPNKNTKEEHNTINFGQVYTSSMDNLAELSDFEQVVNQIKVLVASFIAEEIIIGSCSNTYHPEFDTKALDLAISLFLHENSKQYLSKQKLEVIHNKAFALYEQCKQEVRVALESNRELLSIIAQEIKKKERLTGKEIQIIIDKYNNSKDFI